MPPVHRVRPALSLTALAALAALGLSCNGGSPKTPTEPANPLVTNTITITAAGVSPQNVQVAAGTRVLFVNSDTRSHNMASDPHPEHTDCPELNQIGLLSPGQSRETGNLNLAKTCRFHDHDLPNSATLKGAVVIR